MTYKKMNPTSLRRFLRFILLVTILSAAAPHIDADNVKDLPVKEINGRQYYYYQVKPKDTFFSLTRSLGVSRSDIEKYNPATVDGLKAYSTLYFPVETFSDDEEYTDDTENQETAPVSPTSKADVNTQPVSPALSTNGSLY